MDWQDQLRRLDKELSEGEISAQDYRRRRDELLAEASAPAQGKGSLWASARPDAPAPAAPPAAPPAPAAPAAPPAAPAPAAEANATEDTQVVDVSANGTAAADDAATVRNEPPAEDPDKTATVSAATVAASGQRLPTFPPRPTPAGPPPPTTGLQPPAPWSGQVLGEEVFADAKPRRGGARAALIAVALVVVLAVAGGAVWLFVLRTDTPQAQQSDNPPNPGPSEAPSNQAPSNQAPSSQTQPSLDPNAPPAAVADALKPLPGAADPNSGTITAQRAGGLKLVALDEVKLATDHRVSDVIFRGSTNGNVGNALLVFTTPDAGTAGQLTDAERGFLRRSGFTDGDKLAGGPQILQRSDNGRTVYRVVYTSGRYTVRLGVAQREADPGQLRKDLEALVTTVTAVLPVS
ncbi:hypothetical protein [Actinophytocola sp.]|uniref:hypothetical protein n=1 Tax=Actinophytocola sp. TaxID=1872138 RepID=UPI002ED81E04